MIIWCDGQWIDERKPAAPAIDRGLTLGDGIFETVLWNGDRLLRFDLHAARLHASARSLDLPPPPVADALAELAVTTLRKNAIANARAAVRITWSAGAAARGLARPDQAAPMLIVSVAPSARLETPATLATSRIRRNETAPSARHKTLSCIDNVMALHEALGAGAEEALLLNSAGNLACGARTNLICVLDDLAVTPRVEDGALPGTVRAALMASGLVVRPLTTADLARAEAVAITNALQGIRTVARCDGRALAGDHPLILRLRAGLDM
ncbi:MAG: aminotransferase class IV [Alphaproteobacteria bacterium]|nr:aminotransferase class IV [Alphaproteobacteria bacterium]